MSTLSTDPRSPPPGLPLLVNGDRMKQPEFHRRYLQYPEDKKFELVGGIVYMASPLSVAHSDYDDEIGFILALYRRATPGTQALHNATAILGEESEPQPDLGLRILPGYGGQSNTNEENLVDGAPELLVEIAHSRRAIAMHGKRSDYQQEGVVEYVVICVEEYELHWFDFSSGSQIAPDRQGIAKSKVFPGLWIDVPALLAMNSARVREVAEQGLASSAHKKFVRQLAATRRRNGT
jgi:Uma2 family endonuclease